MSILITVWRCDYCNYPWGIPSEDPNAEQYAKCSICGHDEWHAVQETAPRLLTINLDTGEWVEGGPISGQDGARIASSVLPGMPIEEVERAYSKWLCADLAPTSDLPGFEGTRDAVDGLGR